MLRSLKIKNLAIIDQVELELGPGLNVLTGETGAGKSILVTALELVLGGKGRADLVRGGAVTGEVEARFDLGVDTVVRKRLEAAEVPLSSKGGRPSSLGEPPDAAASSAASSHPSPNGHSANGNSPNRVSPNRVSPSRVAPSRVAPSRVSPSKTSTRVASRLGASRPDASRLDTSRREASMEASARKANGSSSTTRLEVSKASLDVPKTRSDGRGGELVVRRVVSANGRTRAYLNGKAVSQQELAYLVQGLADISSQHQYHTLTDPSTHLNYLDAFAGAGALRRRVARAYHALLAADGAARDFEARVRDREARQAVLHTQIREIEDVAPELGEDVELEQASIRLRGMDELVRLTAEAADLLYERDDSVVDGVAQAGRRLARAAELDPVLGPLSLQLESLRSQLEDVAREIVRHAGDQRPDPAALVRAEERIHQLSRLKRRYGDSLQAVLACLERCRGELDELGDHAATSEALELARTRALADADAVARALSAERRDAATRLSGAVSRELSSLGMGEARVHVELTPVTGAEGDLVVDGARLSADGLERAEFLIAPNRGEEARSLHRVASGGELSRAMLAIKCVLADLGPAGMYAFDEVDAGIGGGMAEIIGRKIRHVAQHRQVLCITHLAQIAVFADQHFKVEKVVRDERTLSVVRQLSKREQHEEIARMLGGLKITAKTRAVARELLLQARPTAAA
jgi:DNA repair protein RecN (Recombination protein N)